MANGAIELDLPDTDEGGEPVDPARRRLELLALLLVALAVGQVLQGWLGALAVSQVGEGQPDVPTTTLLLVAANGAQASTVLALAGALAVLLLAGVRRASSLGRGVLAAVVVASGVVAALALYLFQEVVRSGDDRYAPFGEGSEAPSSQVFFQRLSSASAVGVVLALATGTAYLAWRAANEEPELPHPDLGAVASEAEVEVGPGAGDDAAWAPPG